MLKQRILLTVALLSLFIGTAPSQNNCGDLPPDSYQGSICYGYAMVRAIGYPRSTSYWQFRPTTAWLPTDYFIGPIGGDIQEGDIVVWGPPSSAPLSGANAHAAYVAYVGTSNTPLGDTRMDRAGVVRDMAVPTPPGDWSNILLDQVDGAGAGESINQPMSTVNANKVASGHVYKGIYRLRPEKMCLLTFSTSFGPNGTLFVGKDRSGDWLNVTTPFQKRLPMNATVQAKAVSPQEVGSTKYNFNPTEGWKRGSTKISSDPEITVTVGTTNQTYTAYYSGGAPTGGFVTFENRSDTIHIGSIVLVNGDNRFSKTDQVPVGATATAYQYIFIGRVHFTFSQWKLNGALYSTNRTITPTVAGNYQAFYTFNYVVPPDDITLSALPEGGTKIAWTPVNGTLVNQIQIWRQVRTNKQVTEPANMVATLSASAPEYVDYEYTQSEGWSDIIVDYDVRTRYRVNNATSSPAWFTMWAESGIQPSAPEDQTERLASDHPADFSLSAFPNPFNPATTLQYSLANPSYVELTIFDVEGRIVSRVLAAPKSAGSHTVTWSGTGGGGSSVPSGTYFARLLVVPDGGASAVHLTQKLVLMK